MSRFSGAGSKAPARRAPRSVRLQLEELEDRTVPTVFTVAAGDVNTLIADIVTANSNGQSNTINLTDSTYDFTSANNNVFGPNALPAITGNITINGNGAVLQRDPSLGQNTPFRFFYVSGSQVASPSSSSQSTGAPVGSLSLENLTLQGGLAQGGNSDTGGGGLGAGGAIFNMGNLNLNGVTVEQSVAEGGSSGIGTGYGGGGIGQSNQGDNGGGYGSSGSTGTSSAIGVGGAGTNTSSGGAGGFGGGGGSGTTQGGNGGFGGGGGAASTAGGNVGQGGFGAGAGNGSAGGGGLGAGGALFDMYGTTTLINCTLADNLVEGGQGSSGSGGGAGYGGAVFNLDATLNVVTSTLADNGATGAATGGGAIYNLAMGTNSTGTGVPSSVTLTDSILADSAGSNDLVNDQNNSTAGVAVVNATAPNIITSSSTLDGSTTNGTPITTNPQLSVLANNGGMTPTLALLSGSPAVGTGATGGNVPSTDQRGVARGSSIDLGAYQGSLGASTSTPTPTAVNTALTLTSSGTASSGSTVTLTATVAAASGSSLPAGTVIFVDATTGATLGNPAITVVNGQAQATLTTTSVNSADTITATYTSSNGMNGSIGSLNLGTSSSSSTSGSTLTLTGVSSSTGSGLSVTLTAAISPSSGNTTPAGTVTFVDTTTGTTLGSVTVAPVNGQAQATLSTTSVNLNDAVTATFTSSNGIGSSKGSTTVTAATSTSQTQQWLNAVYQALLNRPIDATGLAAWSAALGGGTSPTQVVLDIMSSNEYLTDQVQSAYQSLLGTAAPSSAVSYLVGLMQQGTSFQTVEGIIAGSTSFYEASGGTNQSFLNALYLKFLNRPIDPTSATAWGGLMAAGYSPTDVALGVLASSEYATDLVEQDYQTYMGRQADPTSLAAYVAALTNGTMTNNMVIASLLGSQQYISQSSSIIG
ncbi:MAG: DUF4214 domain-containing protein [Gemmataceae bacterium]